MRSEGGLSRRVIMAHFPTLSLIVRKSTNRAIFQERTTRSAAGAGRRRSRSPWRRHRHWVGREVHRDGDASSRRIKVITNPRARSRAPPRVAGARSRNRPRRRTRALAILRDRARCVDGGRARSSACSAGSRKFWPCLSSSCCTSTRNFGAAFAEWLDDQNTATVWSMRAAERGGVSGGPGG